MEAFSSLNDALASPAPSEFMDISLNDDAFVMDDYVTESNGIISTSIITDNLTLNAGNFTLNLGPVRDPLYIVIPITILYSVIFFTGVVGNVVTCIVIARNKHMHTATNYYLFSLAVSDLLLLVSGLPQEIYYIWSRYPYVFGEVFCVLRGLAAETSANATVLTITAFTVERYVAICHPFLSHTMSKLSRAIKLILIIWFVALGFAIPQAIQFGIVQQGNTPESVMCTYKSVIFAHSFELSTFLFFVTPMTLITVLYALIGLRLRRSNLMKKESGSFSCKHSCSPLATTGSHQSQQRLQDHAGNRKKSNCCRHQQSQSSRRVLKMLVAVVVAFFICWAPFHAQRLVAIYGSKDRMMKIYEIVTYISGILYYLSTTINPILYHTMSLKFREAFKDTIARCCRIKAHRARRSYSILSRSAQRGAVGSGNAGQESTDYSGNSVKEEVFPGGSASGASSVKEVPTVAKKTANNWIKPASEILEQSKQQSNNYGRSCSVVINAPQIDVRTSMVHQMNQENKVNIQGKVLTRISANGRVKKNGAWKVLHCVKASPDAVDDNKALSVSYSTSNKNPRDNFSMSPEMFGMIPVCRGNSIHSLTSSSNNVSNSSLRDVERGALEDELTAYMEELRKREVC